MQAKVMLAVAAAFLSSGALAAQEVDGNADPAGALAAAERAVLAARGASAADRAGALARRAVALIRLDRFDEAKAILVTARALVANARDAAGRNALGEVQLVEANLLGSRQAYADAAVAARTALATFVALHGAESLEAAEAEAELARNLISQSKFGEGLPLAEHAWIIYTSKRPAGDPDRIDAGFQYALGLVYSRQAEKAEAQLRSLADEAALLPPDHAWRAKLPHMLGTELLMQGRSNEAVPYLRAGVDAANRHKKQTLGERADVVSTLGIALLFQDRPAEALPLLETSRAMFAEAGALPSEAGAYINAGAAADRAGDRARGLALREQGLALFLKQPSPHELGLALNRFKLAQSYAHAGRLAEAEAMETQATDVIFRLRPEGHFQNTNARIALGWIKTLNGKSTEGLPLVQAGFRRSVGESALLQVSQNRVVGVLDNIEAYSQALDAALRGGDQAFAFEVLQVMLDSDASRAAVAVVAREQAGASELGKLLKRRQEAAGEVAAANAADLAARGGNQDPADTKAALNAARAALTGLDADLDGRFPGFRALLQPRKVALADVQRRLSVDEAVVLVAESDVGLVTMALDRDRIAIGRDAMRRHEVRGLVARIRAGIDAGRSGGAAGGFDAAAAHRLHDAIFTSEVAALTRGKRLRIVSGDILSALPFSLLASRVGPDGRAVRWLIEDHALAVAPSIAALATAAPPQARTGRRFVGIGAPALGGARTLADGPSYFAAGRTRSARVADLEPLPRASAEIQRMAAVLRSDVPPTVLMGRDATEPRVRALDLSGIDVLLFATHGLVAGAFDAHSEPALVLTPPAGAVRDNDDDDGLLTASEAALLDIDANWAILSACDTAAADQPQAPGYTGLARAFLFAGARNVVASHWPVRDDVSERMTLRLVRAGREGQRPDEALRTAILSVMRDRKLEGAAEPATWAPFMLVAR